MKLFVLAGGFGTRLKKAVTHVPKVLAPIGDVPFLRLQLENWLTQGLREFTFLLHHQSEQIIAFIQEQRVGLLKGCRTDWLIEPAPMDTGGAIARAVKILGVDDDFLVANADSWLGGGMKEISQSGSPAMAVVNLADVSRYGQVHFDEERRIFAFSEKNGQRATGWINAGLYHLSADLFKTWDEKPFSLERELFEVLAKRRLLNAVPLNTGFIDIGVPAEYHRFCQWVASGRLGSLCG